MKTTRTLIVPPGGFAGNAQQTAATQQLFAKATGARGGRTTQRRRRKAKAKTATRSRKRKSPGRRKARLVKGSAAAKRFMASIRRKRKK